jgi:hypothetical protein
MAPWPVALFVGFFLLVFCIPVVAFAMGTIGLLFMRLVHDIVEWRWASLPGTIGCCAVVGMFAYLFGSGAFMLAADVIDGLIGRFVA